jgi:MFS family permease
MGQLPDSADSSATRRGFASALTLPIIVLLALQLMGGMMLSPHRTFFPIYAKGLGYSAIAISTMSTARMVASLLASLIGGTLSDSLGRKWTLLLGNLGFLMGCLLFLTPSAWGIGILWALCGFGMGLHTLGGQSYLMDNATPLYLGVLAAFFNWGYTLGGALSSPVAGFLLERWNYGVFAGVLAVFALLTMAVNAFLLPGHRVHAGRQHVSLKNLFGYGNIATRPSVILLSLIRILPTVYWGVAGVFMPLLLSAAGATLTTVAWYATASQVVASLAQVAVGRAADRFGAKWPTVLMFVVLVICVLCTGALPNQLWSVFAFGMGGTAAAWSLSTLLPSLVSRVTVPEERGRVLGWIHLWWNAAMIAGSLLGGALYERGPGLPFLVAGALNVVSVGLVFVFFGRHWPIGPAPRS